MTALEIHRLGLAYGDVQVLKDVSLPDLPAGSLVGVLGPNGAGKSTLLRAIAGLRRYSGSIALDGVPIVGLPYRRRVELIGYMPQELPQATSLVAYEAVVSACRAVRPDLPRDRVNAAVEAVFDRLDLRHLAFHPLAALSGGQRQMVGLAQVVVRRPAVLLLDEPTSSLDLRWQIGVFDVVRATVREQGGIALMALHDMNLAMRHCDLLAVFGQGRLLAFGAPGEAMSPRILRDAYGVSGRIEVCSAGRAFVVADGMVAPCAAAANTHFAN